MFHYMALLNPPHPPSIFSSFPFFTPSSPQFLKFPRIWKNPHSLPTSFQSFNEEDEHVIGDCLVYEEGIFDDPISQNQTNSHADNSLTLTPTRTKPSSKKQVAEIATENLVPDKWREVQAELNITKKERRKIAQEMEFNSKVMKKRQGLVPLRDMNLDEYKAYKEAKLAQLKPLVLDNPSGFPVKEEGSIRKGGDLNYGYDSGGGGSWRVEPKNPKWAVYGRGLDNVTEFFNSEDYDPASADTKNNEGRRRLFTKEEKALLNKRVPDLEAATSDKWLPLHTLAACGEFYLLDSLIKHNVDINAVDKDGLTALHKAIIGKKQAITNYLLRNSANPFVLDRDGATLLHYAVQTASSQTIKILLLYNVDLNLQDNDGWTPLHLAIQAQRTDLVRLLLIKGADKTIKNKDGLTPLDLCLYFGQSPRTYELIKLLKLPQRRTRLVSR
ncbi:ankyrin repeat domain-containing protein, chloroplastic [Arachis ipaensis]|uniref:ankyrin repeat domain-containing protein, chloroplastic n=1 Tax=Arachis ipaensis TaxID=130454 RepID=UPI000A2B39DC|nr:ankyrin repeat domain-containing protein, chloroplastic [Arachis ipaensis]XP_020978513.1 ankyrin repeat domain-containing protein, chloroplastic [Arachis ipaensis]XP_020978514.1 ankyrin repeat domain-containing protein, chloroplastic [Arachis ipaensis]XP_020978515.1 ankyrin repeat domain-containing protein, chloroplastic [Arachis ipaensis]